MTHPSGTAEEVFEVVITYLMGVFHGFLFQSLLRVVVRDCRDLKRAYHKWRERKMREMK